jgi:hypothetical protein
VLTPVMATEPEGPLLVGEAETPTLTNEKRRLGDVSGSDGRGKGRGDIPEGSFGADGEIL